MLNLGDDIARTTNTRRLSVNLPLNDNRVVQPLAQLGGLPHHNVLPLLERSAVMFNDIAVTHRGEQRDKNLPSKLFFRKLLDLRARKHCLGLINRAEFLVQNLANCERLDFTPFLSAKTVNLEQRIPGEIKPDEVA